MQSLQWHSDEGNFAGGEGFQLALVFGHPDALCPAIFNDLQSRLPGACVVGSTAGNFFHSGHVFEHGFSVSCLKWENGRAVAEAIPLDPAKRKSAKEVADHLSAQGELTGVIVLWNEPSGSVDAFLQEFQQALESDCPVVGGLAADPNFEFEEMAVYHCGEKVLGTVVGLYGSVNLTSAHRTGLAWIGKTRNLTKTDGCAVLEIDGEPAVDVLSRLGIDMSKNPEARGLSSLQMVSDSGEPSLVRTPLRIDEESGALICGAPVPEGSARFLPFTDSENILKSATHAVEAAVQAEEEGEESFCLVINCAARYRMLGPLWELEMDYLADGLRPGMTYAGFYAYGEIAPLKATGKSELHSQTITVASISG